MACLSGPDAGHKKLDIEFAKPEGVSLLLDLHLPKDVENAPLVVHIHGGGWVGGDRKNCSSTWLTQHGYAVASIEYRMSSESLFPAQIHDCKGAIRWLRAHAKEYSVDASTIVVIGTSAGGHLVAMLGTSGGVNSLEGLTGGNLSQSSHVQGVIDYYGPSDFVLRSKFQPTKTDDPNGSVHKLIGGPVADNMEKAAFASPVTYLTKEDPPMLIFHGDADKVVYLRQSEHLNKLAQKLDVPSKLVIKKGAGHGWKRDEEESQTILNFLKDIYKKKSSQ